MKAYDVAYVRFSAPDLEAMEAFLVRFGMTRAVRSSERLVMRGTGPAPALHVTDLGEARFLAFGIAATGLNDLAALAAREAVAVEALDLPGGGNVVRLHDPDGHLVEVVAGQPMLPPLPVPPSLPRNEAGGAARGDRVVRIARGPSHVMRLGHVVLGVADFRASERWYKERFGFLTSDEIQPAPGVAIGAFMRCDRGLEPCDHHTLFLFQNPSGPGFMHAAFEVLDIDDLMAGREHLLGSAGRPVWGVGRHILGSQVFDYWHDPWGHEIEHWTDGDRLTAGVPAGIAGIDALLGVQWGMPMPPPAGAPMPEAAVRATR